MLDFNFEFTSSEVTKATLYGGWPIETEIGVLVLTYADGVFRLLLPAGYIAATYDTARPHYYDNQNCKFFKDGLMDALGKG